MYDDPITGYKVRGVGAPSSVSGCSTVCNAGGYRVGAFAAGRVLWQCLSPLSVRACTGGTINTTHQQSDGAAGVGAHGVLTPCFLMPSVAQVPVIISTPASKATNMTASTLRPLQRLADLEQGRGEVVWVVPVVAAPGLGQVLVWDAALSLRSVVDAAMTGDARVLVLPAVQGSHMDQARWVEAGTKAVGCVPWCGAARER